MIASDSERMMTMITSYSVSQIVHAAAVFSLADHLANGPASAEEIAEAERTDPRATFRLLRGCASLQIVKYDGVSRFQTTPLLDTLRKDRPASLRGLALTWPATGHWLPWNRFVEAVRTGRNQTVEALGSDLFEYLEANAVEGAAFNEAMTGLTLAVAEEAARRIDTAGVATVADIGGGNGAMLHALLRTNAELHGIVFDLPHVVSSARATAKDPDIAERLGVVGGDFFRSVPNADLYLLKHILHDWEDDACIRVLENCRRSMRPGGRVCVIEMLLGEIGDSGLAPFYDLTMLVMLTGRERRVGEYQQLLHAAGLHVTKVTPMDAPLVIVEAAAAA